jgi:hypothetical protein
LKKAKAREKKAGNEELKKALAELSVTSVDLSFLPQEFSSFFH